MSVAFTQTQTSIRSQPSPQWSRVTQLSGSPEWFADSLRSIVRLQELQPGWDGDGGPAIRETAINSAWEMLNDLERYTELPSPNIGPTVGGGLGIEWRNDSRELDLEILPDGRIEYLKTDTANNGSSVTHMTDGTIGAAQSKEVRKLIGWLMTGV